MQASLIREPVGGWQQPWPQVFELAATLPADRWALIGGLMVQAHALASDIDTTRVTLDVDATVRLHAGAFSYAEAAAHLTTLGYQVDRSTKLTYRFRRGTDIVDLMVPDHERPAPRHARREVMPVAGGAQAMGRLQLMDFRRHRGAAVQIPVPTVHGALILKAAAHMVDSRDRDRHLLDAITLLACITDIGPIVSDLRGSDRSRLRHILLALDEQPLIAAQAPTDTRLLASRTADELRTAIT